MENKWLQVLLKYAKDNELSLCPECRGELEVIILEDGRGSTTFHCLNCNKFVHFDGKKSSK